VPQAMIGRRLALEDFAVKKPPAPSVSGTAKRKLKIGDQRLGPQSRRSKAKFSEIAEQRPGSPSLTRDNVGGSHTAGYRMAETVPFLREG